jgi:hypothetical protein
MVGQGIPLYFPAGTIKMILGRIILMWQEPCS